MSATEIHRLIVRLVGDGRSFENMMKNAIDGTHKYAAKVKNLAGISTAYQGEINRVAAITNLAAGEISKYQQRLGRLEKSYAAGTTSVADYTKQKDILRNRILAASTETERHNRNLRDLVTTASAAAKAEQKLASKAVAEAQRAKNKEIAEGRRLTQAMLTPLERHTQELLRLDGLLQRTRISQETYNRAVIAAKRAYDAAQPPMNNWGKTLLRTGGDLRNFGMSWSMYLTAPITAFGFLAGKAGVQMDSLRLSMNSVTGSTDETGKQLTRLREIAKLPGLNFKEAIEGSVALQAAGFSANKAERALKAFGNALATVGKGRAELHMVNRALVQIAGKGKIMAQEVNQIAEHLPQIRTLMMKAFGSANSEEISKMGISAEVFLEGIIREAEKLPRVARGARVDIENLADSAFVALSKLGTAILDVVGPSIRGLSSIINIVGDSFSGWNKHVKTAVIEFSALVAVVGPMTLVLGTTLVAVGQLITAYKALNTALVAYMGITKAAAFSTSLLQFGLVSLTVAGIAYFVYKLSGADTALKEFNAEVTRTTDLSDKLLDVWTRERGQALDVAGKMEPAEHKNALEKQIKENIAAYTAYTNEIVALEKKKKEIVDSDKGESIVQGLKNIIEVKRINTELEVLKKQLASVESFAQQLREKVESIDTTPPGPDPELVAEAEKFIKSLQLEQKTLFMTSREAKIYQMWVDKLPPSLIAVARAEDTKLTAMEKNKKVQEDTTKALESYQKELNKQIATVGMTKEQVELWELAEAKVKQTLIDQLRPLQERAKALQLTDDIKEYTKELEKQAKQAGLTADQIKRMELADRGATAAMLEGVDAAILKKRAADAQADADKLVISLKEQIAALGMSAEAAQAMKLGQEGAKKATVDLINALAKQKEIMEEGAKLVEKHKTPVQKYIDQYKKLREMFIAGVLGAGAEGLRVFKTELEELNEELRKAQENADVRIRFTVEDYKNISGLVMAGSDEFMQMKLDTMRDRGMKNQLGNLQAGVDQKLAAGANPLAGAPAPAAPGGGGFFAVPPEKIGKLNPKPVNVPKGQDVAGVNGKSEIGLLTEIAQGIQALVMKEDTVLQPIEFRIQ